MIRELFSKSGHDGCYYKCTSIKRKKKSCEKATVKKQWLEDLIIHEIRRFLDDPDTMEAVTALVIELQGRESLSLPAFEKQLSETNAAIDHLLNAIQQGILTKSTKQRLEQMESSRDELALKL